MARRTVWLVMFDKPGSGEIPDGGETRLLAYTSATAARRGAADFAARFGVTRARFPWKRQGEGKWIAAWKEAGDEFELEAIEVELLNAREAR